MTVFRRIAGPGLFVLMACMSGCVAPKPRTVDHVDLDRYAGKWYEIARIPHLYEHNCVAATEWFSPMKDGQMQVVHRCHQDATYGYLREDVGVAKPLDSTNAKLRIHMGLAGGDFWVLALDPEYQYAMVGTPDRQSLWILSRKPILAPEVDEKLFRQADDMGYDMSKVQRTPQPMGL